MDKMSNICEYHRGKDKAISGTPYYITDCGYTPANCWINKIKNGKECSFCHRPIKIVKEEAIDE
jgi:hypothetical protein